VQFYITQIVEGIATGTLYGLVGLAMMFVYRSNRVFNFAQGEMATAVTFFTFVMLKYCHPALAVVLSLVFAFLFGFIIEFGLLKLVRERDESSTIIVTVGLYAIINSLDSWLFGFDPNPFPTPFPEGSLKLYDVVISYQSVGALVCALLITLFLYVLFKHTLTGIAFQAMAESPVAAKLKGIRVSLLIPVAWGISAIIGGLSGMLVAHSIFLHPHTMGTILLYAFAASVIGGLQSSFGALAGGMLVGVAENLCGNVPWIGSQLRVVAVFLIILAFLLVRPRGLFGRDEPRKI
jgi:branched-chain amino acid transport system permease protein